MILALDHRLLIFEMFHPYTTSIVYNFKALTVLTMVETLMALALLEVLAPLVPPEVLAAPTLLDIIAALVPIEVRVALMLSI